jgi:hypothetical protein
MVAMVARHSVEHMVGVWGQVVRIVLLRCVVVKCFHI